LPPVNEIGDWFNGWSWSPNGKFIAGTVAGWRDKEIRPQLGIFLYSLETRRYEKITDSGTRPEWFNDSRHLLFIYSGNDENGRVGLADSRTKKSQVIISMTPIFISSAGISPDSRRIFYTATHHQADIYLLSLDK
jgi:Tol biopolymer transport system component